MLSLLVLTIISVIIITFASLITKQIEKRVLLPIAIAFISMTLFIISIMIGQWKGIGLGVLCVSLFIASAVSLITVVFLYKLNPNDFKIKQPPA